jgi:hypothetical protein
MWTTAQGRPSQSSFGDRNHQADISLHRAEADDHIAALLAVARRRALEPIMLEDVEVETTAIDPVPRTR